ncbi:cell adhesion molecule Dscam2 [Anabrus simplex]|uniref:cell adhesion molecule Dscam2 n=1 Tax=Anabrus simplex TaxID=316456 RepID=UPI0035A30045
MACSPYLYVFEKDYELDLNNLICLFTECVFALLEGQGPLLVLEPPPRFEFSNTTGGRLDCSARGSPLPTVKWLLADGSPAGGIARLRYQASNGSLIFPPFSAAEFRLDVHRAVYRCMASNTLGKVLSRDVKLRAVVMQDFMVGASSVDVLRGNSALLRCTVASFVRDFLTVTSWLQDRTFNIYPSSDGDGKFHMLPSGELVVRNTGGADGYSSYQCRVTHRLSGETRVSGAAARITVTEPRTAQAPRFIERLINLEARRDELVVLPCVAQGHPPPDYRWELGGITIEDDEQRYSSGGLLILPRARPSDSGRYVCVASNSAGSARLEITLLVSAPLSARVLPVLLTAALGEPAEFICTATGHPITSISWLKDGQPLSGVRAGLSGEVLPLSSISKDDQGMYQCFVKNENDMAQGTAELRLGDTPPQLVYSFIRQTIQPGPSISLKCVATGNPPPSIRWTLDGFPLPQGDRNKFVIGQYVPMHGDVVSHVNITSVRVEDGGTYQCTAINRVGEVTHSAQLNVYGSPYVRPMGEISAVAGETLRISCPVAGYPIDNIKWYRGSRPLPINTRHVVFPNGTLVIEKVQSGEDDGSYQCVASNKQGRSSNGTAQVNVTVPPKITPFSFRSDLHLGERVGVQCVVSKGDPPLKMQWLKNGLELGPSESEGIVVRNLDEFTSVLSIGALARSHGGNYTCLARNTAARTAHSATLSVNVPPAITPFSFGELSAGERVRVTCSVKRGDPPLYITWLKDARSLPTTPGPHDDLDLIIQDVEEYSSVLAIRSVSSRHSGNYTCVASNRARNTTYTAQLLVTVPPTWVVEPKNSAAKLGQQAMLDCRVEGFPQPSITWKKSSGQKPDQYHAVIGQSLKHAHGLDLSPSQPGLQLLPNGSLYIETVSQEDEGRYVCEASNGIGVGLSAMVDLTVHAPVHFKVRSRKEMVRRGSSASLRCQALGDLPISFSWRKEGTFLELQGRTSIKNITVAEGLESELSIDGVQPADGGIYTCFARNEFGHDQTAIHLLVQDSPALPTNVRVLDQDSRRVSLAWTPAQDGNSPITRYIVRYSPIQDSWKGPSLEVEVDGSQSSALVTSLHPATLYSFRVIAENTLGPGAASQELLVRTQEEPPSSPPQHVNVEATSSTQLILTWEPPEEEHWNGPLLGHYVGHRQLGDSETKRQYNFTTVTFRGSGKEEARLDGLKKFCQYGLVVQAFNGKGPGPLSKEVVAQTLEDVPEASPRDVRCTALSSESLQVSWQPPPEALVHGVIQGYRLLYEPVSSPEQHDVIESRTKITTALTTVLHGLLKFTNYSVELLAFTRVGDGVKSLRVFCHTKEDAPGPPSDIKALLQKPDTALVAWLPPVHPNGLIIKYNVYVRVVENGRQVDARSIPHLITSRLQYQLPGLKRQLRYEFWVTAFTKVGEGKSTAVAPLTAATKVTARVVSFGGMRLVAWKDDVVLPCQAVGIPDPIRQWRESGDAPIGRQRLDVALNGSLLLSNAQRSDQGEYTCHVANEHGKDHIKYQLVVQVPPSAPLLLVTGSTQHSLQLQWKLGDNGGSPVRGFVLHYKLEHGEWEEEQLESTRNTHVLTGLRCGTQYYVFVTAYNRVGSGDPSQTLPVRTRGSVPLRPATGELLTINSSSIGLHLHLWPDGGCPMLYFVVEYAAYVVRGAEHWIVAGNNIGTDKTFQLVGLSPGITYKLRVTAHNAAGATLSNYVFTTLSELGGTVSPSHVVTRTDHRTPLHKDVKMVVLAVVSVVALLLSFLGVCFCLKKRAGSGPSPHPSLQDVQSTATQDNKQNLARREQYYATVRKLPSSPATLECIPEYSEDIRPYATFHVPGPPSSDNTKLQTFVYRDSDMSPTRKSVKSEYCRVKRSRPNDEYDSFGSESDTEPGTSSRTESSNQLDDGGIPGDLSRSHHAPVARLAKGGLDSMYPGSEWSPPREASPATERRPFVRRYCQAHLIK